MLGRGAVVHVVGGGDRFGERHADLRLAGRDHAGARAAERGGVAEVRAARRARAARG
ncbi:MAG: hypothetical protein MZW92_53430 [Comamonadaceae bacterium]|nr:hypothetical protein [Comamonadaceae bacterium]